MEIRHFCCSKEKISDAAVCLMVNFKMGRYCEFETVDANIALVIQ